MNIVILDGLALNPGDLDWEPIEALGTVVRYDHCSQDEVVSRLNEADIVVANKVLFSADILQQIAHVKAIILTATGYNNVDVDKAKELGISVHNVPAYSTNSVVQLIFSFILHFSRKVVAHNESVVAGKWEKSKTFCYWDTPQIELTGKRLGIIGFGNIGRATAQLGIAFGMDVVVSTRTHRKTEGVTFVSQEELFATSDFIALACALTPQTKKLINSETLGRMKKSAILINTGRGQLVDEQALADALKHDIIAGAGVDVLEQEPPIKGSPLIGAKNCIVTPHIGWATLEARQRCMRVTQENIEGVITGRLINRVN